MLTFELDALSTLALALLLLGLGAGMDDGGAGPTRADGVGGSFDSGTTQLVVDDQLVFRIGAHPPRLRPVGSHQSSLSQLASGGCGVDGYPVAYLDATGVVMRRQVEIHGRTLAPEPPVHTQTNAVRARIQVSHRILLRSVWFASCLRH